MTKDTTIDKGNWVKLHREMFDNKLWTSEKFTKAQAWIDLFGNANHSNGSFWVRGIEVKIKRGQLGWSEVTMTKRWMWSRKKVRLFLKWLESEQQIEQQKYQYITSITTILNYDKYQDDTTKGTAEGTAKEQQKNSKGYINKKNKNVKKKKNTIGGEKSPPTVPPPSEKNTIINNNKENNTMYEEPTIDYDTQEFTPTGNQVEDEKKKRLRAKANDILNKIEDTHKVKFTNNTKMRNTQAKVLMDLMVNPDNLKVKPSEILKIYGELYKSDYWQEREENPSALTIRSHLSKQVK